MIQKIGAWIWKGIRFVGLALILLTQLIAFCGALAITALGGWLIMNAVIGSNDAPIGYLFTATGIFMVCLSISNIKDLYENF